MPLLKRCDSQTRRDALRLAGLGAGTILAGCIGDQSSEGSAPSSTPSATPTSTLSPTPDPVEPEPPETIESEWPVPAHDSGLTNHAGVHGPDGPVGPLWTVEIGDELTSPIVTGAANSEIADSGAAAFVGTRESVVSVDARTGEERWIEFFDDPVESVWAVTGGLHVVGESTLYGLDPETGDRRLTVETDPIADAIVTDRGACVLRVDRDEPLSIAWITDETVQWTTELDERGAGWGWLVDAGDAVLVGAQVADVITWWAVDPETGQVQNRSGDVSHYPVPVAHRDGATYALEAFYATLRRVALDGDGGETEWSTGLNDAYGGPWPIAVSPDTLYTHTTDGDGAGLHALDAASGDLAWTQDGVEEAEALVSTESSVLVHDGDELRAFDPGGGTERWQVPVVSADGGLCIVDDLVIVAGENGLVGYRSG